MTEAAFLFVTHRWAKLSLFSGVALHMERSSDKGVAMKCPYSPPVSHMWSWVFGLDGAGMAWHEVSIVYNNFLYIIYLLRLSVQAESVQGMGTTCQIWQPHTGCKKGCSLVLRRPFRCALHLIFMNIILSSAQKEWLSLFEHRRFEVYYWRTTAWYLGTCILELFDSS